MKRSPNETSAGSRLVLPLDRLWRTDLERAGGKAANLGELAQAGFPVPPGFVLTTLAYDRFVAHNSLSEVIAYALLEEPDRGAVIRAGFESAAIPPDVEREVLEAYQQLEQGAVAVRSSATAEDLPEAAFAGQQETFLNVASAEMLLEAVRRCWASLWTDRAIAYRDRQGIDQAKVKLAVLVQCMVPAEWAGVMFTANPVTGARDEIVIDANPGLGEAVVAGLVTPDHFVLRKQRWGWQIVERRTGRREVIIQARPGGGTEHLHGTQVIKVPALPDYALRKLRRFGTASQRLFGRPQDVEWAWADGQPFILQSRPMTALPEPPPQANRLQQMLASNFGEMLPVRPHPLDMDSWIPALGGAVEPLFELLGLDWNFARMFEAEDGVITRYRTVLPRPTWRLLLAPVRLLSLIVRYDPVQWQSDPLLIELIARARNLESLELHMLSWEELLAVLSEAEEIPSLAGEVRRRYFPGAVFAAVRLRLLLGLLGHSSEFITLLSGAGNKTLEANAVLEVLAQKVRSDPELANSFSAHHPLKLLSVLEQQPAGRAFLAELQAFMDVYGHREAFISTALQPTWKDEPEIALGIVKAFAANPPKLQTGIPAWQVARQELIQHPRLRFPPLRSGFVKSLAAARTVLQIREDTHFYATMALPILRRTSLELGRRLAAYGTLANPEDVFHLTLAELRRVNGSLPPSEDLAGALRASVLRRKEARDRLEDTPLIDPRLYFHILPEGDAVLRGMPGSPGVAEGPARIVRDDSEFDRLGAGEVLVAPYTNPSWTPLFQRAVAVVVDTGSAASHAAIVAREYGIPAVMSTITGTRTLNDGEPIRVDGNQGVVFRITPETGEAGERYAGS